MQKRIVAILMLCMIGQAHDLLPAASRAQKQNLSNKPQQKEKTSLRQMNDVVSDNENETEIDSNNKEISVEANIGISSENRKQGAQMLNTLLADQFLLYVKMLNFHWNVKSHHFNDLHAFFKSLYEAQFQDCDDIAERVRALDETSFGTLIEFSSSARLKEFPGKKLTDQEMIKQLLEDLEAIIRTVRVDAQVCAEKYNDMGTNNFLLNLLEKQEKTAWMLRASIVK